MEYTDRRNFLRTKVWIPPYVSAASSSSSSSGVQVDLRILWEVEYEWMNIDPSGVAFTINNSVVENLNSRLPLFDYRLLMSTRTCRTHLFGPFLAMGVNPSFHDSIVRRIVGFARSRRNLVSCMDTGGMILPLLVGIRLQSVHVRNEQALIDFAARESMAEVEGGGEGMIPATDASIEALTTETVVSESGCCTICLEELGGSSETTAMPCSHVFHGSCIIRWLKQSHVCPICRFEMPTDNS